MWFKVDDNLFADDKVLSMKRAELLRVAAIGLWTLSGSWSGHQESDGFIPAHMVEELGGVDNLATALVEAGLWEQVDGGYQFHNWGKYQALHAELEERRQKDRERKAGWGPVKFFV